MCMEWLGPSVSGSSFGPENPSLLLAAPPPPPYVEGVGMMIREFDCITCLPGRVCGILSSDTQD